MITKPFIGTAWHDNHLPSDHGKRWAWRQWIRFNGSINEEPRGGDGPYAHIPKTALFAMLRIKAPHIIADYRDRYGADEVKVDLADVRYPVHHNSYQIFCCQN